MEEQVPPIVQEHLRLYYTELLSDYPNVLTTQAVSKITGYGKTSINNWCNQGHIRTLQGFSSWRKIRDLHTADSEGDAE